MGDDPLTTGQVARSIQVVTSTSAGTLSGTISVTFNGKSTTFDADPGTTDATACTTAFTALENVQVASCAKGTTASGGSPYTVTFEAWPEYPEDNNLFQHSGNPVLSSFSCDVSAVTGSDIGCTITDVVNSNIKEYEFCSRRGVCNFATGMCTCKGGYTGVACNDLDNVVVTTDSLAGFTVNPTGAAYTGSVLHLKTAKASASSFKFLQAEAGSTEVFYVRGDGHCGTSKFIAGAGGVTSTGGLTVTASGIQVSGASSNVITNSANTAGLILHSTLSATFTNSVLKVRVVPVV
jgi:hypothetical protein